MMNCRSWILFVLLIAGGVASAEDEPAGNMPAFDAAVFEAAKLTPEVKAYQESLAEIGKDLLNGFEEAEKQVRRNPRLSADARIATIEGLQQARMVFDKEGTPPELPLMDKAVALYLRKAQLAVNKLDGAVNKVVASRTKAGDDAGAKALLLSRNELVIGPGHEFVGEWKLASGQNQYGQTEQVKIEKLAGRWSVQRAFFDKSLKQVGSSYGTGIKLADGQLAYTEKYQKKPVREWDDSAGFTISLSRDNPEQLLARWQITNGQTGQFALERKRD